MRVITLKTRLEIESEMPLDSEAAISMGEAINMQLHELTEKYGNTIDRITISGLKGLNIRSPRSKCAI